MPYFDEQHRYDPYHATSQHDPSATSSVVRRAETSQDRRAQHPAMDTPQPTTPPRPSTRPATPTSARSSLPSTLSHLLIDNQAGDVVTPHSARPRVPTSDKVASINTLGRTRSHSEIQVSPSRPAPPETFDTATSRRGRPPRPSRDAWHSFPPSYTGLSTPAFPVPTDPPPRRPRPHLPSMPESVTSNSRERMAPMTAPLLTTGQYGESFDTQSRFQQPQRRQLEQRPTGLQQQLYYTPHPADHRQRSPIRPPQSMFSRSSPPSNLSRAQSPELSSDSTLTGRAWFMPGPAPNRDASSWSDAQKQGFRQGFEDAIQSVSNGTMGIGEIRFSGLLAIAERNPPPSQPSPSARYLTLQNTPRNSSLTTLQPQAPVDRPSLVPPPQSAVSSIHRMYNRPPPPNPVQTANTAGATRTHPPPAEYSLSEEGPSPQIYRPLSQPRKKRQVISCYPCRKRRLGCSGEKPCSWCRKRNITDECKYAESVKRRGKGRKRKSDESEESAESSAMAAKRYRSAEEITAGDGDGDRGDLTGVETLFFSPERRSEAMSLSEEASIDELVDAEGEREGEQHV